MKKFILIVSFLLLRVSVYSQETKLVVKEGLNVSEEYYVLKHDKRIKHGAYVKYQTVSISGVKLIESGQYKNNQKDGLWAYFYRLSLKSGGNNIKERGHYANGKKNGVWVYYYLDTIPDATNVLPFGSERKKDSIVVDIDHGQQKVRLAGSYLNDKRVGEWISFDKNGNVYQQYNFSKRKLILDRSFKDTVEYSINRMPLYIGGPSSLTNFLNEEFDGIKVIPKIIKDSASAIVSFVIDSYGHVTDAKIYKSNGPTVLDNEAIRAVGLTDMSWIPATSQTGEILQSNYKIQFTVLKSSDLLSRSVKNVIIKFRAVFD
jgi:TonB family protein